MKRFVLATIYAWLSIVGGLFLIFQGWTRLAGASSAAVAAASAFQGFIMLATGIAILRQHSKAVGLVWTSTALFALGVLARGIVPLDLLLWLLLLAFAIWFTKKSKAAKPVIADQPH